MSDHVPRYDIWQAYSAVMGLAIKAIEEGRALARQPGPQGEPGRDGAPGQLPITKAWEDRVYDESETVTHNGNLYQAIVRTGKEPKHADWRLLVPKGVDGRTPVIRGTFDQKEVYRAFDVVANAGGSLIALKDDPGPCPGPGWQLLAGRGKDGARGDKGERGDPGLKGAKGDPAKPVGWREDIENYRAFPVYADGTEGAPLSLRGFFERYHFEVP